MRVRLKRVYLPPSPDDGLRILVYRLWPRGLSKGGLTKLAMRSNLMSATCSDLKLATWRLGKVPFSGSVFKMKSFGFQVKLGWISGALVFLKLSPNRVMRSALRSQAT